MVRKIVLKGFMFLAQWILGKGVLNWRDIQSKIERRYDLTHPSTRIFPPPPDHHARRCQLMLPQQALGALISGAFRQEAQGQTVIVSSPCLGIESLGNYLGNYLETVSCARKLGVAYLAVAKVYEPRKQDASNAFLSALPSVIEPPLRFRNGTHPSFTGIGIGIVPSQIFEACPCRDSCHQNANALWPTNIKTVVVPLLRAALVAHRLTLPMNSTVELEDLSSVPVGTILPFTPDAVVHYRCGDNFVGHYGFLPFSTIVELLPKSVRSIYVLAESRSRKAKMHLASKCDGVLAALHKFLVSRFPRAIVLLRRGDDPFSDMVRLYDAPFAVCSVSTFCLWPVLASNNSAFYPSTNLVLGGSRAKLREGFRWTVPPVRGSLFERESTEALVRALGGGGGGGGGAS